MMFKDKAVLFDHGLFFDFGHFGHFFVWAGNLTFLGAFPNADRQSWMHITRRLEKGIGVLTFSFWSHYYRETWDSAINGVHIYCSYNHN